MTQRDTDFDSLRPGDQVTVVWTVSDDGLHVSSGKSGLFNLNYGSRVWRTSHDAFVSHRAPRPLEPGDRFVWNVYDDPSVTKTVVWIDDKTIVYDYFQSDSRTGREAINISPARQPVRYVG